MKIGIIGTGMVGSSFAYRLMVSGIASEIVMVDVNLDRATGEALDIFQATPVENSTKIYSSDREGLKNSDILVITAGLPRKPGESRLDLIAKNTEIFKSMIPIITKICPNSIYVVASNPVDLMTLATIKYGGLNRNQVVGTGTMLDTMRFRATLSEYFEVSPLDINAFVLGEHGDSQVACYSCATINGIQIDSFAKQYGKEFGDQKKDDLANRTKKSGAEIISKKMATYYGIASGLMKIVQAIARDEKTILPVSSMISYNGRDICNSFPTVVGKKGVEKVLDISLSEHEQLSMDKSNKTIHDFAENI